jgi:hypothetical protein
MSDERHPATTDAWEWLEKGEGQSKTVADQELIRRTLHDLDEKLLALDRNLPWPEPAPLPDDYWESAT